jgi:hypothetical protein
VKTARNKDVHRPQYRQANNNMSVSYDRQQSYRSAVYLNNAAATLLSRGDAYASLHALKGAIALMGPVVTSPACSAAPLSPVNIKETEQHLARPRTASCSCPTINVSIRNFDGTAERQSSTFDDVRSRGNVVDSGLFLRLDELDMENDDEYLYELAPAILLSNFALVHLALAPKALLDGNFLDQVLHLLDMATTILGTSNKQFDDFSDGCMLASIVVWHNICFALLLHSSSKPSADDDREEWWQQAMRKLGSLQLLAQCLSVADNDDDETASSCLYQAKPAAAA